MGEVDLIVATSTARADGAPDDRLRIVPNNPVRGVRGPAPKVFLIARLRSQKPPSDPR